MTESYLFTKEIPFQDDPFDGINNFLFNKKKLEIENHVLDEGTKFNNEWGDPIVVIDPLKNSTSKSDNFASEGSESLAYFIIQYKYFALSIKNDTIRTRTHNVNENFPKSWKVEGSYDGNQWDLIHSINDTLHLCYVNASKTYPSQNTNFYSFFRFTMTKENSGGSKTSPNWIFHVSKVEFFGSYVLMKDPFAKITCIQTKTCRSILFCSL